MAVKNVLSLPGEIVKKHNSLARARVMIKSVESGRILAKLIAMVRSEAESFERYEIEGRTIFDLSGGKDYKHIEEICRELVTSTAEIASFNSKGELKYIARPFFAELQYADHTLTARFNDLMKPYLLELKSHFVKYNLIEYLLLPSIYSQRLFEILVSWSSLPEVKISISELGRMLNIPEYMKSDFRQFRVHVLEKAHRDITTKTSFRFDWEPIKAGRCIESIRFLFNGKRKAISKRDKGKAQEERRKRLQAKRYLEAIMCAKEKGGDCQEATNKRLVCKVCLEQGIRHQVAEELQQEGKGRKEPVQCSFFE